MVEECVFCKMAFGEINVRKIYENDNFFSIPDAHPRVKGHSLIISKRHFKTFLDLPGSLGAELLDCIKETALIIMKQTNSKGFNLVNNNFKDAGQIVEHVHFHILPRRKDDGVSIVG